MIASTRLIQSLAECHDKALAGGKAVNLGQLIRAGFPVPGGFVITTEAYRHARVDRLCQLSDGLAREIRAAWQALGGVPVAVRSSATAEDMHDASMAGQYETFLNVSDEDALLNAIECCWASLDTPRTRTYLAEQGIDLSAVAMAVVVQKLVPADVAGVLFTANPRTGSRQEMVIEASWGLGEAVVSGHVQPDVLVIDGDTGRVIKADIADKRVRIRPGDRQETAVEEPLRKAPCLRSGDVEELWKLARRGAEYFGSPQDMEWAIHEGEVYLLQSRPITTLAQAEVYEQILQRTRSHLRRLLEEHRGPWALHNISESLKHPTPLTWSVIRRFMSGSGGFGAMYREAGFEPAARVCTDGFLELIGGRVYMDVSLAPEMFFESFPFRYDLEQLRSSPDAGQAPPTVSTGTFLQRWKVSRRVGAATARLRALSHDLDRRLREQVIPEFVSWCRSEKSRNLAHLSSSQLIELWQQRADCVMGAFAPQSLLPSMVCAMALNELRAFLAESFWDEDPDALAAMLSVPAEPDQTILASAQLFEVAAGRRSVDQWMEAHGHRAPDEFDLATPRWRERRDELAALASQLKGGADPMELHRQHARQSRCKLEALCHRLDENEARELVRRIALVHRYMSFREDGKYYLMLGYDLLRDVAQEAGRRLDVNARVFQLTVEELFDALRVGFAPTHLIALREVAYEAEGRLVLPQLIDARAVEELGEEPKVSAAGTFKSFPVSTGVASGPVRVVQSPQKAEDLGQGYILVCPSTDPGWTPLFINAAGLVLERGGTLSHGAVIAREMNVPAVVLAGATSLFRDGEKITVDGRNGLVSREGAAAAAHPEGELDGQDLRLARHLVPPVPGRGERSASRIRNMSLVIWGVYLAMAFLLPETWVYQPTLSLLDTVLWPLVRYLGKPAAVATVAVGVAALSILCQYWLTDNARLREAKRRASALNRLAMNLPRGTPRRLAMLDLVSSVQMRVAMASLVPLAVLLGPMVMSFVWLPARVDVNAWNASPGSLVSVVATISSEWRLPVVLEVHPPLQLEQPENAARKLDPIRETLEQLYKQRLNPSDLSGLPWESQVAAQRAREEYLADLKTFLSQGVPPQTVSWQIRSGEQAVGRFPVMLKTEGVPPLTIHVVLGDQYPPGATKVSGPKGSPLVSVEVIYSKPDEKHKLQFWTPLAKVDRPQWLARRLQHWEVGWLLTYLVAYLPAMFGLRWLLKVA